MVAAFAGWVGYAVYGEAGSSHALDQQVLALQRRNQQLQHDIDSRQAEIAAANGRAWLMEQARMLGYVLPGERVFILTPPGSSPPPDGGIPIKRLPALPPPPTPSPGSSATPQPTSGLSVTPTPASPTPYRFTVPSPTPH